MAPSHSFPLSDALGAGIAIDNTFAFDGDYTVILVVKDGAVHAEVRRGAAKTACKFCADEAARVVVENP